MAIFPTSGGNSDSCEISHLPVITLELPTIEVYLLLPCQTSHFDPLGSSSVKIDGESTIFTRRVKENGFVCPVKGNKMHFMTR